MAVQAVFGIIVGLVIIWGGGVELFGWARSRRRTVRTAGVVVGRVDVGGQATDVRSRSAHFRFTTTEGQVVEAISEMSSFPGPKPGKSVKVTYDPADPQGTAEISGVATFKVAVSPLIMAGGVALTIAGIRHLG